MDTIKNAYVINNLVDANVLIDVTYNVNKSTLQLDKRKSYSLIQEFLQGKQPHESEEGELAINKSIESGLISNPNQIVHYKGELYVKILEHINLEISKRFGSVVKKAENRYTEQTYFSVCRVINDLTPPCSYLGLTYRILDPYDNQVVKLKISPYYNEYAQEYEVALGFGAKDPKHVFCISQVVESAPNLSPMIKRSMISTMTINFYRVLNHFFPDGLDKNRPFYSKDLETLRSAISQINQVYNTEIVLDEKGIIVSRNKNINLTDLKKYLPPISSYVLHH